MNRIVGIAALAASTVVLGSEFYDSYVTGPASEARVKTSAGLLLEGGGGDVETAWRWFLDKAGNGDIVVLRASGSDGYNKYLQGLAPVHSVASYVTKTREASAEKELLTRMENAEGVFLAGGDQWNYVSRWKGTPLGKAIDAAYARGVPVGGTSAGLAVLGEHAFSAEKDTVTSAEALANPFDPKVTIESDFLHFAPMKGRITDSHFSRRDRMGRLLVWLARLQTAGNGNIRGIGIDEGTAVMVDPEAKAAVAGKGAAYIVQLRAPVKRCVAGQPLDGAEYSVCRIPAGVAFDWKSPGACVDGKAYTIAVSNGVARSSQAGASLY